MGFTGLGFGAEEVAAVEPLLVTYNEKGEVEGVKYDRLSAVFVNAFNEKQAQIMQQQEIALLKQWLCRTHPKATMCQAPKSAKR